MKNEIILLLFIGLFLFVSGIYVSKLYVIKACTERGFIPHDDNMYIKCQVINQVK